MSARYVQFCNICGEAPTTYTGHVHDINNPGITYFAGWCDKHAALIYQTFIDDRALPGCRHINGCCGFHRPFFKAVAFNFSCFRDWSYEYGPKDERTIKILTNKRNP